jgi:hypothetical protein
MAQITAASSPDLYSKKCQYKAKEVNMADNNTTNRGFANMNEDKQRDIARRGGEASAAKQDMSKLGKKGAEAQPHEAKVRGGQNSHKND